MCVCAYVCMYLSMYECKYIYILNANMKEVILNAGVNNIPKAGVDVISKDALTRMRRGARFTTYVPKMLK